jgi:glycosyltransferase involved in cell wall biosynthesis
VPELHAWRAERGARRSAAGVPAPSVIRPEPSSVYNNGMTRLAWFTPLPPVRSGIAAYSAELLPHLADRYQIDVFVDERDSTFSPRGLSVHPAHRFVWKHSRHPYDLMVYQLGNATYHDYMWPHLARHPGLVVLHDAQLHHSRARALLSRGRLDDYREEVRYNHPDAPSNLAEIVIGGHGGAVYYSWPMLGIVMRTARLVAVHSSRLAANLGREFPETSLETVHMGVAEPVASMSAAEVRARHGIREDSFVFAAYGGVTPEKRIPSVLRAFISVVRGAPNTRLMLVGRNVDYYDVAAEVRASGLDAHVIIAGFVPDEELAAYVRAADACLCLRWPTSRETSASWLRCLAAGKPTVITDLAHVDDVPTLDPRSWTVLESSDQADVERSCGRQEPCAVSIDLLDEVHSLTLAMRRLARDPAMCDALGRAARLRWEERHTLNRMATDYGRAIRRALGLQPARPANLPRHFLADGTDRARALAAEMGVELDFLRRN